MEKETAMTLWGLIKSGGWVMAIIFLLSLASLGLIIKFLIILRSRNLKDEIFERNLIDLAKEGDLRKVSSLCRRSTHLFASIILSSLTDEGENFKSRLEEEGRRAIILLQQSIRYLADIGVIAPMLGLLGTVIGMIQAFQVVAYETGVAKPVMLAAGISKALVTTAAGLIVGIPSMAFYFYFRGKINQIIPYWEKLGEEIVEKLGKK
ncbi:MotA/TolQ/ExbB proton channel family protein [Candidatus Calescamantes bacterium]|nr:MotA/TolQ/ExbB proton channel family protein [Candidatus Calescamantes bacterium]